jgi:transcription antitermination factor NusG
MGTGFASASTASETPWFALRIRSNFEKRSATALEGKGFEHFLPTYRVRSYWSDRVKWIDKPLFPGYVFCRFDPGNWLPVLQTPGIIDIVRMGAEPAAVEEQEIASLRRLLKSSAGIFPHIFLQVGKKVLIKHGPLAGVEGVVQSMGKGFRVIVTITLLQRSVAAEVEADWLVSVN